MYKWIREVIPVRFRLSFCFTDFLDKYWFAKTVFKYKNRRSVNGAIHLESDSENTYPLVDIDQNARYIL
jgi:hypothetical protein